MSMIRTFRMGARAIHLVIKAGARRVHTSVPVLGERLVSVGDTEMRGHRCTRRAA